MWNEVWTNDLYLQDGSSREICLEAVWWLIHRLSGFHLKNPDFKTFKTILHSDYEKGYHLEGKLFNEFVDTMVS